jgi:hypothetical protein
MAKRKLTEADLENRRQMLLRADRLRELAERREAVDKERAERKQQSA